MRLISKFGIHDKLVQKREINEKCDPIVGWLIGWPDLYKRIRIILGSEDLCLSTVHYDGERLLERVYTYGELSTSGFFLQIIDFFGKLHITPAHFPLGNYLQSY